MRKGSLAPVVKIFVAILVPTLVSRRDHVCRLVIVAPLKKNISCYLSRGVLAGGRSQEAPAARDLRAFFLDRSLNPLVP